MIIHNTNESNDSMYLILSQHIGNILDFALFCYPNEFQLNDIRIKEIAGLKYDIVASYTNKKTTLKFFKDNERFSTLTNYLIEPNNHECKGLGRFLSGKAKEILKQI